MRSRTLALILLPLAGCDALFWGWDQPDRDTGWWGDTGDGRTGILWGQTRGVVLDDAGDENIVAILHATRRVFTDGSLGDVYDLPGDEEVLDDATDDGHRILVRSDDRVFTFDPDTWLSAGEQSFDVPGNIEARLVEGGFVALAADAGDCKLVWDGPTATGGQVVELAVCSGFGDLTADPETGTAYVGTSTGVVEVTPESVRTLSTEGNLVAWDEYAEVLYVATSGGRTVRALLPDGSERFSVTLNGPVVDLHDMGSRGAAGALVKYNDGSGDFVLVDSQDGTWGTVRWLPAGADSVAVSGDGRMAAFVLPDRLQFLDLAAEPW